MLVTKTWYLNLYCWTMSLNLFDLQIEASCFFEPSKRVSRCFKQNSMFEMDRGVIKYFTDCPIFRGRFVNDCKSLTLSCEDKCGQPKTGGARICSCEMFCSLRNDCCWDFQDHCPHLSREMSDETKTVLAGFNKSCENNFQIIEDVGYNKEFENGYDVTNYIIFDKMSGLSFRNMEVYLQHREILMKYNMTMDSGRVTARFYDNLDSDLIAWKKKLLNSNEMLLGVKDMQEILEHGKKIDGVVLINEAPSNAAKCEQNILLNCGKPLVDSGYCAAKEKIEMKNTADCCVYYSMFSNGHPEPGNTCRLSVLEGRTPFSQLIDLSMDGDVIKAKNLPGKQYESVDKWSEIKLSNNRTHSLNSDLAVMCFEEAMLVHFECRTPNQLVLMLETDNNNNNLSPEVNTSLRQIVDYLNLNVEIGLNDNWNFNELSTNHLSEHKTRYVSVIEIEYYRLKTLPSQTLPVSEMISVFIKEFKDTSLNVKHITEMTVCLGFSIADDKRSEDVFLVCDHITVFQDSSVRFVHFNVTGMKKSEEIVAKKLSKKDGVVEKVEGHEKNYLNAAGSFAFEYTLLFDFVTGSNLVWVYLSTF